MSVRVRRWDGEIVRGVLSRGPSETFAAEDWRALVPSGPIQEIEPKQKRSNQLRSFLSEYQPTLQARDGFYSDLQSLNSEDTLTWAVFRASKAGVWIGPGLREAFGLRMAPTRWHCDLWKSAAGPTPTTTPPEADADLRAEHSTGAFHFTVESKWKQDLKDGQDASRAWNQLDMRAYVARGPERLPRERHGVLVIVPPPALYRGREAFDRYFAPQGECFVPRTAASALPSPLNDRGTATTDARVLTWLRIAELSESLGDTQLGAYLRWRLACFDSVKPFLVD